MLKDSLVVSFDLLLHLQDVDVFREILDLTPTDGVDQTRLTDTIPANQAILSAFDELERGVFEQMQLANVDVDGLDENVLLEALAFVVSALRLGDAHFVIFKLAQFFCRIVHLLFLRLGHSRGFSLLFLLFLRGSFLRFFIGICCRVFCSFCFIIR